jgi:hypothetical protein
MGIEEDIQAKLTTNTFNKIISENFPNLEKEMVIQEQEALRILNRQGLKRSPHVTLQLKH